MFFYTLVVSIYHILVIESNHLKVIIPASYGKRYGTVCLVGIANVSDKNPVDESGCTPLQLAKRYGLYKNVRCFKDNIDEGSDEGTDEESD